jgi:hypothetical protein
VLHFESEESRELEAGEHDADADGIDNEVDKQDAMRGWPLTEVEEEEEEEEEETEEEEAEEEAEDEDDVTDVDMIEKKLQTTD